MTLSIVFQVSREPRLLEQYYRLRGECFRRELGVENFDGSEEYLDRQGHVLLGMKNGRCVGGVRISPHFPLKKEIQHLELEPKACCIWERFVVDPAARSLQMVQDFIAETIVASWKIGYEHALMLSCMKNARLYRHCHSSLGVDFKIMHEVPDCAKGAFADLEHYISVAELRPALPVSMVA
jgi:hypothetical protein